MYEDLIKTLDTVSALIDKSTEEQKTYKQLLAQKQENGSLDIAILDFHTMRKLWVYETCFDRNIAALFDVSEYAIKKIRYDLGIKLHNHFQRCPQCQQYICD